MTCSTIDAYQQMRAFLTKDQLKTLETKKEITVNLWQAWDQQIVPLKIFYLEENPIFEEDLPVDKKLIEKGGYIIYVGNKTLKEIKNRKIVGSEELLYPKYLRMVFLSLEDVI